MTVRRHHSQEIETDHRSDCVCSRAPDCRGTFGPITVWSYENDEQPGIFFGIRDNPTDDQIAGHGVAGASIYDDPPA